MYINSSTQEKLSHRALQDRLNTSFPRKSPPEGWAVYATPEPGPAPVEARIQIRRDEAINSGTVFSGMRIDTSDTTQTRIGGAALQAMIDSSYTVNWKAEGVFIQIDSAEVLAIAQAVRAHVQACYDREAELLSMNSPTDLDINSGWPA